MSQAPDEAIAALNAAYTNLLARQLVAEKAVQCLVRRLLHGVPPEVQEKELQSFFGAVRAMTAAQIGAMPSVNEEAVAAVNQAIEQFEGDTRSAQTLHQNS